MNKLIFVFFLLLSLGFSYNLTSVSDISTGRSNIAYIINHEALLINPAFLHQTKFAISNQQIDTTGINTKQHGINYMVLNGFGFGEMNKQESTTKNIKVGLLGYGSKINKNFSWGLTYETITLEKNGTSNATWSTLLGMSYIDIKSNLYFGITLEHFFKNADSALDEDLPPTIAFGFNFVPWNQIMWSNKVSFVRQTNQKIKYNSGISVMVNDNIMLNFGATETGYALGFDLPLALEQKGLGSLRYAVEVPNEVSKQMVYSFSYTWGK
ncbi:MAG: hypothetical protein WCH76_01095 [Candidatus Riflemargulisbacteria bacterium]